MKLKNKFFTLILVVASAFGLAVSNKSNTINVKAESTTVTLNTVSTDSSGNYVMPVKASVPTSLKEVETSDGLTVNFKQVYASGNTDAGYLMFVKSTANMFINVGDANISKVVLKTSSTTSTAGTLSYCGSDDEITTCASPSTIAINAKSADFTLDFSATPYTYVGLINESEKNIQFSSITITYEASNVQKTPAEKIADIDTKVQLGLVASSYKSSQVSVYDMVTNVADLEDGDQVVIATHGENNLYALGGNKGNNHYANEMSRNVNSIYDLADGTLILTVGINDDGYYTLYSEGGYLYAAGSTSSGNYLKVKDDVTDLDAQWTIAIDEEGKATIQAQGDAQRDIIMFNLNGGSPIFSCYASGMLAVAIYKDNGNTTEGAAEYTYFSDVKLRFVAEIPADLVSAIDGDGEFGINIIGETAQQDIVLSAEHWIVDEEGNVSFAVVVKVPNDIAKYSVEITGQAYVTVDGTRVDLGSKTYSVNGLVANYLDGAVTLTETEVMILEGFQNFVATNA